MNRSPSSTEWITPLIERYRQGDESAASELLERFEKYLLKWQRLLLYGRWDQRDAEIRAFLSTLGSLDLNVTAQVISRRLKAYEAADLRQEIKVALLETALRYGSITNYYRHILRKRLGVLTRDPLVFGFHRPTTLIDLPDQHCAPAPEINESWVSGITCGPGFDQLTAEERKIVQLIYWFGFTEDKAAAILDVSRSTVTRRLRRVREILRVHYLEPCEAKI